MGTFQVGVALERGATIRGSWGGGTHGFLPRLMPESFHPSSLPDRPVIRRGKASSDGCRPSGCRAQEVARLLLCACLLCLGKTGAAAAPRGELRHHCEVHTRGHRVGDLDIVSSSSTLAFTRLPLGAGDEHEGSKDTPRVEFSHRGTVHHFSVAD